MHALLDGIRVVDLTTIVLGPLTTSILGDLGADVIKVEPPDGDLFRAAPPSRSPGMGAAFMNLNRNKRSLCLDLATDGGQEVLRRLVEWADVLVHNVRPLAAARLGIDAPTVQAINPRVVHCTTVGYGSDGPDADSPAYDDVIQGRMGLASLLADDDGAPRLAPTIIADKVTGLYAAHAILAALLHRERTGVASVIEVPMLETMASFLLAEHVGGRMFDPPLGPAGYNRVLSKDRRPYRTADGWIVVLPYTTRQWAALLEGEEWAWVADPEARALRIDELYAHLAAMMRTRTTADWLRLLADRDVPAAEVATLDDLFDDPHLTAVGMFTPLDHPTEGRLTSVRQPIDVRGVQPGPDLPAPRLGADSRQVLAELGYDETAIGRLLAQGVVAEGT